MNKLQKIVKELNDHIKIFDVVINKNQTIECEIDRIQSVARAIVVRIMKKHGEFNVTSTTRNVKHLGFTKVLIYERVK